MYPEHILLRSTLLIDIRLKREVFETFSSGFSACLCRRAFNRIFESFSILFRSSLLLVRATNNENILLVYVVRSSAAVSQTEPEEEEHKKELAVNFEVETARPATSRTKTTTAPCPRSDKKLTSSPPCSKFEVLRESNFAVIREDLQYFWQIRTLTRNNPVLLNIFVYYM